MRHRYHPPGKCIHVYSPGNVPSNLEHRWKSNGFKPPCFCKSTQETEVFIFSDPIRPVLHLSFKPSASLSLLSCLHFPCFISHQFFSFWGTNIPLYTHNNYITLYSFTFRITVLMGNRKGLTKRSISSLNPFICTELVQPWNHHMHFFMFLLRP